MRLTVAMGMVAALAGCLGAGQPEVAATPEIDTVSHLQEPGCYTVDLFREVPISEPAAGVTPAQAAFLGEWGNGVWNGTWCHDLLIHRIDADGTVELLDMHAPSEKFRQPATIFKRTGRIREDGTLRFVHGLVTRRYELRDGKLFGFAEGGPWGSAEIVMTKKGVVPLPRPRPVMIAKGPVEDAAPAAPAQPADPDVAAETGSESGGFFSNLF